MSTTNGAIRGPDFSHGIECASHGRDQPFPPQRGAFGTRRRVTALSASRIAKSHRDNGDVLRVIEASFRYPHPFAQAIARGIGKRNAAGMDFCARRLARDQNASGG